MDISNEHSFLHPEKIMRIMRSMIGKIRHAQRRLIENPSSFPKTYESKLLKELKNAFDFVESKEFLEHSYSQGVEKKPKPKPKPIFSDFWETLKKNKSITKYRSLRDRKIRKMSLDNDNINISTQKNLSRIRKGRERFGSNRSEIFESTSSEGELWGKKRFFREKKKKTNRTRNGIINTTVIANPETWFISPRKSQSASRNKNLEHNNLKGEENPNDKFMTCNSTLSFEGADRLQIKNGFKKSKLQHNRELIWQKFLDFRYDIKSVFVIHSDLDFLRVAFNNCFCLLWCDWVEIALKSNFGNSVLWGWENFMSSKGMSLKILTSFQVGINIVAEYDPNNDIDKIEQVYNNIPPHLTRFVALQQVVSHSYLLLAEIGWVEVLIQSTFESGTPFQHFWVIEKIFTDAIENDKVNNYLLKLFDSSWLHKLYNQCCVFGNGSKFLSLLKCATERGLKNSCSFTTLYSQLWLSKADSLNPISMKDLTDDNSSSFTSDEGSCFSGSDDSNLFLDSKIKISEKLPGYSCPDIFNRTSHEKWLMRVPDPIGSSRLLFVVLKLLFSNIVPHEASEEPLDLQNKEVIGNVELFYRICCMACIKLCSNNIAFSNTKDGPDISAESVKLIVESDPIPPVEYLEQYLDESLEVITNIYKIRMVIYKQFKSDDVYSGTVANRRSAKYTLKAGFSASSVKLFQSLTELELSFSLLAVSFYSKCNSLLQKAAKGNHSKNFNSKQKSKTLNKIFLLITENLKSNSRSEITLVTNHMCSHIPGSPGSLSNEFSAAKNDTRLKYSIMESVVRRMAEWGCGSRGLLDTASCLDAMGFLPEAKGFLLASWKIYDRSNLRSNEVHQMKKEWVSEAISKKCNRNNYGNHVKDDLADIRYNRSRPSTAGFTNNTSDIIGPFKRKDAESFLKSKISRADIVAYLEALDYKTDIHSNNNILSSAQTIISKTKNTSNPDPRINYQMFHSPIKQSNFKGHGNKCNIDDELALDEPAFVVSSTPTKIKPSTENSLFSSPLPQQNIKSFENFEKKMLSYSKTPLRSPYSIYPFLKHQIDNRTPTKSAKLKK